MKNLYPPGHTPAIYKAPVPPEAPVNKRKFFGLLFGIPFAFVMVANGFMYLTTTPEQRAEWAATNAANEAQAAAINSEGDKEFEMQFQCKSAVSRNLRNPDSYEVIKAFGYAADGFALVEYRAENGFGGLNTAIAQCNFEGDTMVTLDMNRGDSDSALPVRN